MKFPYNPDLILAIKDCPGRRWHPAEKRWEVPLNSLGWLRNHFPEARYENLNTELEKITKAVSEHREIKQSFNSFIPHSELYGYQKDVVHKALQSNSGYGIFLEQGIGKTFVALELIRYFKEHGISPALVICPLILIKNAWFKDCQKFYKDTLKILSLRDTKGHIPAGYDIYVLNYEMFRLPKNLSNNKREAMTSAQIIKYENTFNKAMELLNRFVKFNFKILMLDESSNIKDNTTQTTRAVLELGNNIRYKYCLSGTPAPNSEKEYWAQLKTIGAIDDNFYKWRRTWFRESGYRGYDWKLKRELKLDFYKQFDGRAVFLKKDEALDLPDKVYIPYQVEQNREELDTYELIKEDVIRLLNDEYLTLRGALPVMAKLRQVVSGFCYREGKTIWEANPPSKIEVLKELLKEINSQVIIWIQFNEEKRHILKHFKGILKIGCLTGEETLKEKEKNIDDFISGKLDVLTAHPDSAKHGLTFTNCNYTIYYSRSFSLEQWIQSQDRLHRRGQTKKCFYYILQTDTWIDKRIDNVLEGKEKMSLDLLRSLKG
ncbi:MAG: SNF2-related protein [bacterium]